MQKPFNGFEIRFIFRVESHATFLSSVFCYTNFANGLSNSRAYARELHECTRFVSTANLIPTSDF